VLATEDIKKVESRLGRSSVDGNRRRPDGTELGWKQIGVLATLEDSQLPFFIQWLTKDHPSTDGKATAKISKIEIAGDESKIKEWLDFDISKSLVDAEISWVDAAQNNDQTGILSVELIIDERLVTID
jgi:hypothetical protein